MTIATNLSPVRPGVGSPFSEEVWDLLAPLRVLDPQLDEQMATQQYTFERRADDPDVGMLAAAYQRLEPVLTPAPQVVIAFSWLKRGGAEWVGVQLVREAQRRYGCEGVLVLVLDWDVDEAKDWLPEQSRVCVLMREAPELSREQRKGFLLHYLGAIQPALLVNCNSGITWDLMRDHGAALAAQMRLSAFAFCFDYTEEGAPIGYPVSHLPRAIQHLSVVISDNRGFRSQLKHALGFPQVWLDKVVAVYQPIELPPATDISTRETAGRRPLIAWASRLCRQKRPELVIEIARLRPDYDFVVYGDLYEPQSYTLEAFETGNLRYAGSYRTLSELPVSTFDAFLYTAAYDGLPNILLAAGGLGVPVVAAVVGGIDEVIDESTGWPVEDHAVAEAYARRLDEAMADPVETARRAQRLRARIVAAHSDPAYRARIDEIELFPTVAA